MRVHACGGENGCVGVLPAMCLCCNGMVSFVMLSPVCGLFAWGVMADVMTCLLLYSVCCRLILQQM